MMLNTMLSHSVKELDVLKAQSFTDAIYIDAREKDEFEVSHLKNAIWIGYENQDLSKIKNIDTNQVIIVYCSVGYRSEKTAEKINLLGYKNVYNLYGGIFEWKNQNLPVFRNMKETNDVHAFNRVWGIWLNKGNKVYDK